MNLKKKIIELTNNPNILELTDFILSDVKEGEFPDYKKLDLMLIPKLVSSVFVIDFRNGIDDGILINFSGRKIDEYFGMNIQGMYMEDVYSKRNAQGGIFHLYRKCFLEKKPFYSRREVHIIEHNLDKNWRVSEICLFPCSSNGSEIDYAIGGGSYSTFDFEQHHSPIEEMLNY